MNPRYFIGVTLPSELSLQISKIQHELFVPHKTMEPLVPHITLLDPNILMELSPIYFLPKVKEAASQILPIEVNLTSIDSFGNHALYVAVKSTSILMLRKNLVELVPKKIRAQYTVGREFIPHVTLVQAKPNQTITEDTLASYKSKVSNLLPVSFTVESLDKFQWIRPRSYDVKSI